MEIGLKYGKAQVIKHPFNGIHGGHAEKHPLFLKSMDHA